MQDCQKNGMNREVLAGLAEKLLPRRKELKPE
jgi:hypothetical protein